MTHGRLVDALWDAPPSSAVDNLRGYAAKLRRALNAVELGSALTTQRGGQGGYRLQVGPGQLDRDVFGRLAAQAGAALARDRPEDAVSFWEHALGLWRGPAGADLPVSCGLTAIADHLNELRLRATEQLAEACLQVGDARRALDELIPLMPLHPARERVWELLIRARIAVGDRAGAARDYHRVRRTLAVQLGVPPSPVLVSLHATMLEPSALLHR